MNVKDILLALQSRELRPEDAKAALAQILTVTAGTNQEPRPGSAFPQDDWQGASPKDNPFLPSDNQIADEAVVATREGVESRPARDVIAIIGMAGRYPGADGLEQYWNNLEAGQNSIQEVPESRWKVDVYYDPRPRQPGKVNCKWLGRLDDIEFFDPQFFNIPPAQAAAMDPQHRLFLQEGYKAFEDAGYGGPELNNRKCGVYLGLMSNEYAMMLYKNKSEAMDSTGNSAAIAAARIPYFFNLTGPAIPIDTACSSSLVAVHLASQALLNREIDMALAGGVSLFLTPETYISMCAAGMLSPDGQCKTCDNAANGFVPGEGAGALVLKRLSDAEADEDHIYGVIIASGINHNGSSNGITAPSVKSQIELEREIYSKFGINPESIGYVEMHGTGSKLGDSMELEALATVFKEKTNRKRFCRIGSVKSNIGHTAAVSGIAAIQKVLLSLRHRKLAPTLNYSTPNEHFDFTDSPFIVNTELTAWESGPGERRRAAVSSFGYSGSNAHLVIEEYRPPMPERSFGLGKANPILFILSARNQERLKSYARTFQQYLTARADLNLGDVAYTLQVGRRAMAQRMAVIADSRETLLQGIDDFIHDISGGRVLATDWGASDCEEAFREFNQSDPAGWIHKKEWGKIAALWVKGYDLPWNELYGELKPRRVSLPTYPFAKEYCWVEGMNPPQTAVAAGASGPERDQAPQTVEVYSYDEPCLRDHTVNGEPVLIGPTYASLAINAFSRRFPKESGFQIHRLNFIKPVTVRQGQRVEIAINQLETGSEEFQVLYRYAPDAAWDLAATGKARAVAWHGVEIDLQAIKDSLPEVTRFEQIYTGNPAIRLGASYKLITKLFAGTDRSLARVVLPDNADAERHDYLLNPLMVHNAYHVINTLLPETDRQEGLLPFAVQDVFYQKSRTPAAGWLLVKLVKNSGDMIVFDVDVIDDQSRVIASYQGCSVKRLRLSAPERRETPQNMAPQAPSPWAIAAASSGPVELTRKIRNYLTDKIRPLIPAERMDALSMEINLMDLGLNSLQLVGVAAEIESDLNTELNPTLFFEFANLKSLTEFFAREHQAAFKGPVGTDAQPWAAGGVNRVNERSPAWPQSDLTLQPIAASSWSTGEYARDDIAVIGMDGRFAAAENLERFWDNLVKQKDLITEVPPDHWDYRPWFDEAPDSQDKTYCKWGSFIADADKFDPGFFNISPREADWMDPQLRLLMQSIYATAEDAGCVNRLRGSDTGVFVGVCRHDYTEWMAEMNVPVDPYIGTGNTQTVFANRISFLFDLTGPSIAVDTACSSALVALHQACQSLRNHECGMAFVGGANLLLSSYHYRYFSSIKALSPTGRCHSFDAAADGYVPGECIASILLKPLNQARKDGDRIYAVIKGSAALHGGYTPSLTAPSVNGETNVLVRAWRDAGIDPATITYIEAHGTGTKLGDPIEINSLKQAFKQFTEAEHFCAVGTVKANLGHTEGAAGIAGVVKVIMQMKRGKIPVMPMFKQLNPYIDLNQSAVYINRTLEDWKSPNGAPRRAGVSSFGFAGAFAHVVIEDYAEAENDGGADTAAEPGPVIIALSAKDEERLRKKAEQLVEVIANGTVSDADMANLAFTLQVGREAMEERLGCVVTSAAELGAKLKAFLSGVHPDDVYYGQVKSHNEVSAIFKADEELQEAVDKWIDRKKYSKLVDLWVKGLPIDWNKLYGEARPRHISLPSYPFAKERYWVPKAALVKTRTGGPAQSIIHPLLHRNTSDFLEQRYQTIVTGDEFYLRDHVVKGRKMLPGVTYLEMARAAVQAATESLEAGLSVIRFTNIVWIQPIKVEDKPVCINIRLMPQQGTFVAGAAMDFEINSSPLTNPSAVTERLEPVVNCRGRAVAGVPNEISRLDLQSLQQECSQAVISARQLYDAFDVMGFTYGPAQRGVAEILAGDEQLLARLVLPASVSETGAEFGLHPSIMDAALQASLGLILRQEEPANESRFKTILPFAMDTMEISGGSAPLMWAWIRYGAGTADRNSAGAGLRKIDVDLCDEQGNVQVRIQGFSSRVWEADATATRKNAVLMVEPVWKERPAAPDGSAGRDYEQHVVIFCEPGEGFGPPEAFGAGLHEALRGIGSRPRCLVIQSQSKTIEERFENYAAQIFEAIRDVFTMKPQGRVLIQVVVPLKGETEQPVFAGLSGLLTTARLENPQISGQLIELHYETKPGSGLKAMAALLAKNSFHPRDTRIRYQGGQRMVLAWNELPADAAGNLPGEAAIPWRDRGVYLITGGTGGLGLIIAREIVSKAKAVRLILSGRSALSDERLARFKELEASGATIKTVAVDLTDKKAVRELFSMIFKEFGALNGIIHGAGVICDSLIYKKTLSELQTVLGPKVSGLVNVDQASKDRPLDFLMLFSSIAGSLGNPGQADYAAANAFMDAYASYRNALVAAKRRQGKTVSINWPLWQDGGMRISEDAAKINFEKHGIAPLETQNGIDALYRCLASGRSQVMVLEGNALQLRNYLEGLAAAEPSDREPERYALPAGKALRGTTCDFVKKIFAQTLKATSLKIDLETPFEKYGVDSILQMSILRELEKVTGELSKTLLFEYSTIQELADYLVKNYAAPLTQALMLRNDAATVSAGFDPADGAVAVAGSKKRRLTRLGSAEWSCSVPRPPESGDGEAVAIIGVSGRYPQSDSMEELWKHLKAGHNCITKAPPGRWSRSLVEGGWESDRDYYGGFLDQIQQFDHRLFEIAPDQVKTLAPEVRLFLEIVWETFEDGGYTKLLIAEKQNEYQEGIGVFVGTMYHQYPWTIPSLDDALISSNATDWHIANRASHFFNLTGPSMAVNSACSSSLTAIHLACESLRRGNCVMAIAGGVNLTLIPSKYDALQRMNYLGSGNQTRSFGRGNGYIPGEGVGAVLLKPLKLALKDRDRIYAVIKSDFVNHSGGRQRYTVPDPKQQTQLIIKAIRRSGVDPTTIGYVEAAANGSELGDPIEVTALNNAFQQFTNQKHYCALGSVKSNLGHLEAASGISQLSKALLQFKYHTLAPTLNSRPLNPAIKLEETAFYLQEEPEAWKRFSDPATGELLPRRSMINSFGAGGSYANLIVEEFPPERRRPQVETDLSSVDALFVFSAQTEWSLLKYLEKILNWLAEEPQTDYRTLAYSLSRLNHHLDCRVAIIGSSLQELIEKITVVLTSRSTQADSGVFCWRDQEVNWGDTGTENIEAALRNRNLRRLATLWTGGTKVDLRRMDEEKELPWMDLPGYVFDHRREFGWETEEFYLDLSRKIANGELTEAEVAAIIFSDREQNNG
jgi:acyl transferase domain-containing protein